MHPVAFWWVVEEKLQECKPKTNYAGGMTEAQVQELYAEAYGVD